MLDQSRYEVAERTDPESRIREEAALIEVGRARMFSVLHMPPERATAGVVICAPVQVDLEKNYRREVLLARALASKGIAVLRFHYRGSGHSDGASDELTFDSMREDAVEAIAHLRRRAEPPTMGFMGTRCGALIAAGAASQHPGAPLALWDPVLEGHTYFRELFRASRVRDLARGASGRSQERFMEELRGRHALEILGHTIGLRLYETLAPRSLLDEIGVGTGPLVIIQVTQRGALRKEYRLAAGELANRGFSVETRVLPLDEAWFFEAGWKPPTVLVEATSRWLADSLGEQRPA